jgi:hypothetical protein
MAAKLLGDLRPGKIDIHQDNIMERSDGTIVITDPYADGGTS